MGLILIFLALIMHPPQDAVAREAEGEWVEGYKNRVRLFAGAIKDQSYGHVLAFIEIDIDKGWKTYWRNPGTAGGIAPEFDFSQSINIRTADVLYPVPELFRDSAGDTIGYKEHVIFPVLIESENLEKIVDLNIIAHYGICEKLCVPVEVHLKLQISPNTVSDISEKAQAAMAAVPRNPQNIQPGDPIGFTVKQRLSDVPPHIILTARYPGSSGAAYMFLDVDSGLYIPIPEKKRAEGEIVTFELDLSDPEILKLLRGSKVRVTMKGQKGQSEDSFILD